MNCWEILLPAALTGNPPYPIPPYSSRCRVPSRSAQGSAVLAAGRRYRSVRRSVTVKLPGLTVQAGAGRSELVQDSGQQFTDQLSAAAEAQLHSGIGPKSRR